MDLNHKLDLSSYNNTGSTMVALLYEERSSLEKEHAMLSFSKVFELKLTVSLIHCQLVDLLVSLLTGLIKGLDYIITS